MRLQRLYVIATDKDGQRFRVLKIDRLTQPRPPPGESGAADDGDDGGGLTITEDSATYSYRQKEELLETLRAGNPTLKLVEKPCFGIAGTTLPPSLACICQSDLVDISRAGFVRFTSAYHMILITKRSKVAVLGGHHIFHSEGTDLHEISPVPAAVAAEEARQRHSFMSVHLSKNFYFRCVCIRFLHRGIP